MPMEDYKDIVGTCAFVTTMAHMLSPSLMCKDICKKGTAKGVDPMPFIGGLSMGVIMLQYGYLVQDSTMININLFGFFVNFVYTLIYYFYSPDKISCLITLSKAVAFVAVVLGYTKIESQEHIEYRFGIVTTVLFLLLIASPLFNLGEIIRTKSTAMLPFPLIFMGTIVSFQWLLYGLIINNAFIIFQNAVGFVLSFTQLSLFAIYPSTPVEEKADKKEN
ncbi:sugar transporter SWEET1 [Copidosoma floridanum]|uniref:sugar transporter SWEET1 n=1 Tax=Copidosoma floridanum TaxID=29053 RepID=UPI0006C946EF|nr:sugar transporter SWEET1 [Copidosoma floridanum]